MPESAERPHPSTPWWAGGANGLDECSGKRTHELELEGDQHGKEWSSMGTKHIQLWLVWTGQTRRNSSTVGRAGAELWEIHTQKMAVATGLVQKHHVTAHP